MRIIVPAIGSRGDVQPYIALCQGLQCAGHHVTLATNPTMCHLVETFGVNCAPVGPSVDMGIEGAKLWAKSRSNMWLGLIRVMRLASRLIEAAFPDLLELCQSADLVIVSDPTAGMAEAQKLGVPWISVTLQPARVPVLNSVQSLKGRFSAAVVWPVLSKLLVAPINNFRKRVGAPLVQDIGRMLSSRLILVPTSPHVVTPDPRWPAHVHEVGYWTARPPSEWQPASNLRCFLNSGESPIAVSLGAMSLAGKEAHDAAHITLEAIRKAGVRAIVQGWDDALAGIPLPKTIFHAASMPHPWLFNQVRAVIHHGGYGTTAATLRAGIPGIVIPHIIDQFYWAERVYELDVGPRPIPRAKLTIENLAMAITEAVTDSDLRAKASTLGCHISQEPDAISTAVQLIEYAT